MNSDRDLIWNSPVLRLAERWRQVAWAIEAYKITFTRIEGDYLADRQNAEREAAYNRAVFHKDELFDRLAAVRSELYGSEPGSTDDALAILRIMRTSEEDVFEDRELARALDRVIAALSRGGPSLS